MLGRYEIREYIDDKGAHIRSDMVDIDAEMKGLHQFIESQRSRLTSENATAEQKEAFDTLAAQLSTIDPNTVDEKSTEETQFIRDLGSQDTTQAVPNAPNTRGTLPSAASTDLSFLDRLEELEIEDEERENTEVVSRLTSKPKAPRSQTSSITSAPQTRNPAVSSTGWKKGFLGSQGSKKSPTSSVSAPSPAPTPTLSSVASSAISAPSAASTAPSVPCSAESDRISESEHSGTSNGFRDSHAGAQNQKGKVSFSDNPSASSTNGTPRTPGHIPPQTSKSQAAFTGMIVERFP